jgi:hypothetical protein
MITDTEQFYVLEDRSLNIREKLEIECARHRLADLSDRDCESGDLVFTNIKIAFIAHLEERYGANEARDHIMFHIINGSTPDKPLKHYDFPGADSVRKFLDQEYRKFQST